MSEELTPVPDCSEEEAVCEQPAEIHEGQNLLVVDPATKCNRMLRNADGAILWTDGNKVVNRTGAKGDEIALPSLMAISGSWPFVMGTNNAGELLRREAPESCRPHIIVSRDGSWDVELFEGPHCWETICEKAPTELAGFVVTKDCEGIDRYCLVRFPLEELGIDIPTLFFASTSCIQKNGTGTEGDPYKFSIKISSDPNNCIECRDDGLYVQCGSVYYGGDPLI